MREAGDEPGRLGRLDRGILVIALSVLSIVITATVVGADTSQERVPMLVGFDDWPADQLDEGQWANWTVDERLTDLEVIRITVREAKEVREEARQRGGVAFVEPDAQAQTFLSPNDPHFSDQYAPGQVRLPSAWDTQLGDPGTRIGIVDSGVDNAHEDLEGTVVVEHDFPNDDGDAEDGCGHGTHVAGIAAARTNNGIGIAGASESGVVDAKAFSPGEDGTCVAYASDVADAIRWATDQDSTVISMSFGFDDTSPTVARALAYAADAGGLLVASAGNAGCEDCVTFPASDDHVIAVACTDQNEQRCSFSSQGPEVELAAPGGTILSTVPDDDYAWKSGTSMSAPWVAGTAALVASENGSLDREQIRTLLQETAQDLGPEGHDESFGHGEVDAEASLAAAARGLTTNEPPQAAIEVDCTSLTCHLSAEDSSDPDGDPLEFSWVLSDGTINEQESFVHTFPQTPATRTAQGAEYTVELTVFDGQATDEQTREVRVRLEIEFNARPLHPVFGPLEQPVIEAQAVRLDAHHLSGEGIVEDVGVHLTTRWEPRRESPMGWHSQLLAWSPLAQTLRGAGVLYHETTESTISAEWTAIEIPSDAAGTLWAPTPSHRVLAMLDADLAGESYRTSATYRVGLLS